MNYAFQKLCLKKVQFLIAFVKKLGKQTNITEEKSYFIYFFLELKTFYDAL